MEAQQRLMGDLWCQFPSHFWDKVRQEWAFSTWAFPNKFTTVLSSLKNRKISLPFIVCSTVFSQQHGNSISSAGSARHGAVVLRFQNQTFWGSDPLQSNVTLGRASNVISLCLLFLTSEIEITVFVWYYYGKSSSITTCKVLKTVPDYSKHLRNVG